MQFEDVKDVLLADLDVARSQARASEEWHVRVSLIFTLTIITATFAIFAINTNVGPFKPEILFGLINFVILAQFAFLINYHFIYLQLWAKYVYLIEKKIQLLFDRCKIIEFETEIAHLHFYRAGFANLPSGGEQAGGSLLKLIPTNINTFLIFVIHLPSIVIYIAGTYFLANAACNLPLTVMVVFTYSILILILIMIYLKIGRSRRDYALKQRIEDSVSDFESWLIDHELIGPSSDDPN